MIRDQRLKSRRALRALRPRRIAELLSAAVAITLIASSCSVVFTASATGQVADSATWEDETTLAGIDDVAVYLYVDEEARDEDLASLQDGVLPEEHAEERYFQRTTTATEGGVAGVYSFFGLIWERLLPEFGKSGDRRPIYLLFHHPEYAAGVQTVPIINDVTNRLPPALLRRSRNQSSVRGIVVDSETGDPLESVTVNLYIPDSWTYGADGTIDASIDAAGRFANPTFPDAPSRTFVTDADGDFEGDISYPMMPSFDDNAATTRLVLTFTRNGYEADVASDADLANDADLDGDARITAEEIYYLTPVISADTMNVLDEIALVPVLDENQATIEGRIVDANSGNGVPNATVAFRVPDRRLNDGNYSYPNEPTAVLLTEANGTYEWDFTYPLFPDKDTNDGEVELVITVELDDFTVDPSIDGDLIDSDVYGDAAMEVHYRTPVISHESTVELPNIGIRRTELTESLDGRVYDSVAGSSAGINGAKVGLFIGATASPAPGAEPDLVTYTIRRVFGTDSPTVENGFFTIEEVGWTDERYTTRQSRLPAVVRVYDDDGTGIADRLVTIYSGADNAVEIGVPSP